MTPEELFAAWHIQQIAFIEFHNQRVRAMLEMLAAARLEGRPLRVLDLGCGPGSFCDAVADRFPDAEVVGVDRDPILLHPGRETNRHGERTRLLGLDLTTPGWAHEVDQGRFDAVVSATALHRFNPDKLAGLYVALPQVLNPGTVLPNADHLCFDGVTELFLKGVTEEQREKFRLVAIDSGAMTWEAWWEVVRSVPSWEAEAREWEERWSDKSPTVKVSLEFHLSVLRAAGFVETIHIFRWFDDVVVLARLP